MNWKRHWVPHGSFPIAKEVIEGYFDPAPQPAYLRMADLLEQVLREPARDLRLTVRLNHILTG